MTLRPTLIAIGILCAAGNEAFAQEPARQETQNCTQTLRAARVLYNDGRLHELPTHMENCLNTGEDEGGFTKAERIEAYKILTLAHIYLEEPTRADTTMFNLLNADPFVKLDTAVDPIELHNLYRKFKTDPAFLIGGKIGLNFTHVDVRSQYYYWMAARSKGVYRALPRLQYTLFFQKILTADKRVVASPEISLGSHAFEYTNDSPFADLEGSIGPHTITHQRIQVNLLANYRLRPQRHVSDAFVPYVGFGPAVGYLFGSSFTGETTVDEAVSTPTIDTKEHYQPITVSLVATAGFRYKIGVFYLTADVRFQYGLMNVVNGANRYQWTPESQAILDLGYTDSNFTMNHSMLNIGLVVPSFKHIKLTR